jgi:hypothetical protein
MQRRRENASKLGPQPDAMEGSWRWMMDGEEMEERRGEEGEDG